MRRSRTGWRASPQVSRSTCSRHSGLLDCSLRHLLQQQHRIALRLPRYRSSMWAVCLQHPAQQMPPLRLSARDPNRSRKAPGQLRLVRLCDLPSVGAPYMVATSPEQLLALCP